MRDTKYALPQFAFYDRTGIQTYLEKQAAKGWLLEEVGQFAWRFARSYPRKLRFAVVYFPKADLYDPEPGEEEQTFRDFCAHGGWTLAASAAQMQVFYTEQQDPIPIETDPAIEVENIHNSMKKSMLPGYWLTVGLGILNLLMLWWSFSLDPLVFLSADMSLFMIPFWIIFLLLSVSQLVRYCRWRRRARRAAEEDGVFVATKDNRIAQTLVCLLLLAVLLGLMLGMEDKRKTVIMTVSMVTMLITMALALGFRKKMKREGYDAKTSRIATIIACVVLALVVSGVGNAFATMIMNSDELSAGTEELPLSIEELLGPGEYDTLVLRDQKSVFIEYYDVMQVPEGRMRTPRIEYEVVRVKFSGLYERCLAEMMDAPERLRDARYLQTDPAPWGAERAWQLHDGEELRLWYVLCYENAIVMFLPDWELTAEQMAVLAERFE